MTSSLVNRDVFFRDPAQYILQNDGVSKVDVTSTLEYELETFVCEGEYARGLDTILTVFESHLDLPTQPSVWVSGFYGSGKSHLVKILQAVWQDSRLPSGRRPREIVTLTEPIDELLYTLSRNGDRLGGLWSASGMLAEYGELSIRMLILSIVHRAAGLSSNYGRAKFRLWLRQRGWEEPLAAMLSDKGLDPDAEFDQYLVSFDVADGVMALAQSSAFDTDTMQDRWERQFDRDDISYDDMIADLREVLLLQSVDGKKVPLTLLVLDEVQQYIGLSGDRAEAVQKAVELIQTSFDSRVLVVATGQAAL
ncbi:MAG: hypothetical protein WBA46_01390, partial [Thermomicrobiales bacterium]